jgi:ABC-2 type transport system permease protein
MRGSEASPQATARPRFARNRAAGSSSGARTFSSSLLFTPLLAGWSIWVGIAISARSADVRVAQQLGVFASLPPLVIVALMSLNVITPSTGLALGPLL